MSAPPCPEIPNVGALPLELETTRLRLRPFTADDAEALWPFVSDPALPRQMTWAAHADPAETRAWIEHVTQARAAGTDLHWAIVHDGKLVGDISLLQIRWQLRALRVDRAELGFWLAPALWRKGLMTEAAHHVLLFAFDTLGLHKVTVGCFEDNVGSRRVIEKVGFRFVGRLEEDAWRDGAWHGQLRYELTAHQWSDVSTTMPISRPVRT